MRPHTTPGFQKHVGHLLFIFLSGKSGCRFYFVKFHFTAGYFGSNMHLLLFSFYWFGKGTGINLKRYLNISFVYIGLIVDIFSYKVCADYAAKNNTYTVTFLQFTETNITCYIKRKYMTLLKLN